VWFYAGATSLTVLVLTIATITGPPSLASPSAVLFSTLITGIVSGISSLPLHIPKETRLLAGRLTLWSLGISFCALTASFIVTASAIK